MTEPKDPDLCRTLGKISAMEKELNHNKDNINMRQVSARISTYTADVSGVCSALFELGGMTVIHDPSGCNSTYNTHDEPRWYDQDSLVFISGLTQMDAILGNDDKFIRDIIRAAEDLKPSFIALVRTPVPLLNGTDFEGIALEIEARTGIPVMYFPTTGMETYIRGAGMALEAVVNRIPDPAFHGKRKDSGQAKSHGEKEGLSLEKGPWVNILGATPLDFSIGQTMDSLKDWLDRRGYRVRSCLAMGSGPDAIRTAGEADLNLVISGVGLPAARVMEKRFGIPYVLGFPVEDYGRILDREMSSLSGADSDQAEDSPSDDLYGGELYDGEFYDSEFYDKEKSDLQDSNLNTDHSDRGSWVVIGEPVTSISLACAIYMRTGIRPEVISPLETDPEILDWAKEALNVRDCGEEMAGESKQGMKKIGAGGISCRMIQGEAALEEALRPYTRIIADPLYQPICPGKAEFISLPHEAFSGRIYRKQIPDLVHAFIDLGLKAD